MTIDQANEILTPDNIHIAARVLSALDEIQGEAFRNEVEGQIKSKGIRFSHDHLKNGGRLAVEGFLMSVMAGNASGLKMNLSAFAQGLNLLHREEDAAVALQATSELENITGL